MSCQKISVVIPVYNREKTIRYCLDSVIKQTIKPYEVIVVDDFSTDDTVNVVNSFSAPEIRCVVLEQKNGAQAARNRGIQEARGDWIAFLDSDDEWVPEKLERQLEALSLINFEPLTVVHTNCWIYEVGCGKKKKCDIPMIDGEKPFKKMLYSSGPMFQGLLTSKVALEKIGLLDVSVPAYQEWDTSIRLARECHFIHVKEPLFIYHFHEGETISKDKLKDLLGYQYIVDKFRDDIIHQCGRKVLDRHLFFNAFKAVCWGYYEEASGILTKSLQHSVRIDLLNWMIRKRIKFKNSHAVLDVAQLIYNVLMRIK